LIVYFKKGKDILRIPTGLKVEKGKMTSTLSFSKKADDYFAKNIKLGDLCTGVNAYIMFESRKPNPRFYQADCLDFLKNGLFKSKLVRQSPAETNSKTVSGSKDRKSLVNYIEDYIQYRKDRNTTRNTQKEFTTMMNRVKNYDKDRKKTTVLSDINFTWSDSFERYLLKKKYSSGTVEKTFTILITCLNHFYVRKDEMNLDLTDKFRLKGFKRGEKSRNMANPLTFDQFKTLYNHKFVEEYLERTRIRFCLQCSTGIRFSDIHRIKPDMIHEDRIIIKPVKTERHNITAEIDLNPFSRELLSNLNYNTSGLRIENAPYNRNIKTMFEKMQTEKPNLKYRTDYGSHCGRDTFISICVAAGVDFKTILIWTGQSSYSVLDRYISTTNHYKAGQMQKAFI
jgi:integrase